MASFKWNERVYSEDVVDCWRNLRVQNGILKTRAIRLGRKPSKPDTLVCKVGREQTSWFRGRKRNGNCEPQFRVLFGIKLLRRLPLFGRLKATIHTWRVRWRPHKYLSAHLTSNFPNSRGQNLYRMDHELFAFWWETTRVCAKNYRKLNEKLWGISFLILLVYQDRLKLRKVEGE